MIAGQGTVLTATENGFGKRTAIEDYPTHGRGGQGVISIQTTERNGNVVSAVLVMCANLAADVLYAFVDPRIRIQ